MRHHFRAAATAAIIVCLPLAALAEPTAKELKKREALLRELEDARSKALSAIFDVKTYRDEDHGHSGQRNVDELVAQVREVAALVDGLLAGDVQKLAKLKDAKRDAFLASNSLNAWESAVRQRWLDAKTLERNEALRRVPRDMPKNAALPTDAERDQARLTNEYRMLMGKPALEIDARLVGCARAHSAEMNRLRYFDHESPVAENKTISDRTAKAGVTGVAVGENIASGYGSANAAFDGWYHSAGHHRNMLDEAYVSIGVGRDGDMWTQNFGGKKPELTDKN